MNSYSRPILSRLMASLSTESTHDGGLLKRPNAALPPDCRSSIQLRTKADHILRTMSVHQRIHATSLCSWDCTTQPYPWDKGIKGQDQAVPSTRSAKIKRREGIHWGVHERL
jgi:hypothetical protein